MPIIAKPFLLFNRGAKSIVSMREALAQKRISFDNTRA